MSLHVAFLRGVGGPRPARGDELRRCFAAAGYDRVTPVIATGNVVFGMGRKRRPPQEQAVSAMIERHFGYPLPAILRTGSEVAALVGRDPFRGIDPAGMTRFVALLADDAPAVETMPAPAADAGYALVAGAGRDLCFVIDRQLTKTPDVMAVLERTFRRRLTTRTWSTIERVMAVLEAG